MPNNSISRAKKGDKLFRSLYDNIFEAVIITESDGTILSANPAACEMFCMTEKELQNAKRDDMVKVDERFIKSVRLREETGQLKAELTLKRKDGSTFEAEVASNIFTDIDGIVKASMIIRDVTDRKKAEKTLRASEEKYKSLFEQAGDYILVLELPKKGIPIIRDANEAALKKHGYTREEFINQSIRLIDKRIDEAQTKWIIDSVSDGKVLVFEVEHYRKDGTSFTAEVAVKAVKLGAETWILSVERDITKRKKAEEALNSAIKILHLAAEASKSGTWEWNLTSGENVWSEETWRLYGLIPSSTKASFELWLETIHPDDKEKTVQTVSKAAQEKSELYIEYRLSDKHGKGRWLMSRGQPQKNADGVIDRYIGVIIDITERKRTEDRLAAVNEKLRVTGSLTRHDVRNKLSIIKSSVFLLKKRTDDNPELKSLLQDIDNAVDASNKLFEFSNVYEKIGVEKRSEIDVGQYYGQAADLLHNPTIKIVNECKGLVVNADTLIRQLFYNLLDNSAKHGKTVTEARLYFTRKGDGIELIYQDNGVGILQELKPKIFTEGFTTGNGSGLGLMLAKKMVEAYGWSITEVGEEGKGVKFVITIPTKA